MSSSTDLRCPITWDYLEDPVTVPCCGRSFSRAALRQVWEQQIPAQCPMCHGPGDLNALDALPRSISLAYLVEEAQRSEQNAPGPVSAVKTAGDYKALLQIISNHRRPLGRLTVSSVNGKGLGLGLGLPYARQFIDEGMRIPGGALTVVGFLPRSPAHIHQDIDVKQYRLL